MLITVQGYSIYLCFCYNIIKFDREKKKTGHDNNLFFLKHSVYKASKYRFLSFTKTIAKATTIFFKVHKKKHVFTNISDMNHIKCKPKEYLLYT